MAKRRQQKKLRSYASGGQFNPIKQSDANIANIQKRDQDQIRALEKVYKADILNRTKFLEESNRAWGVTTQSAITAKSLDDKARQLERQSLVDRAKTEVGNIQTEDANRERAWQGMMKFAENSIKLAGAIAQAKKSADTKAEAEGFKLGQQYLAGSEFNKNALDPPDPESIGSVGTIKNKISLDSRTAEVVANTLYSRHPGLFTENEALKIATKNKLSRKSLGKIKALLMHASKDYTKFIEEAKADPNGFISIKGGPGKPDLNFKNYNGEEELRRLVYSDEVSEAYLERYGLTKTILEKNKDLVPAFYESIKEQRAQLISATAADTRQVEHNQIKTQAFDLIKASPDKDSMLDAILQIKGLKIKGLNGGKLITDRAAKHIVGDYILLATDPKTGEMLFDQFAVDDFLALPSLDQNLTIGDREKDYWDGKLKERDELIANEFARKEEITEQRDKKAQSMVSSILNDPKNVTMLKDKEFLGDLALKQAELGNDNTVRYINQLIAAADHTGNESTYAELWKSAAEFGNLNLHMINNAHASEPFKEIWRKKARELADKGPNSDDVKLLKASRDSAFQALGLQTGNQLTGKEADITIINAMNISLDVMKKAFTNCMITDGDNCAAKAAKFLEDDIERNAKLSPKKNKYYVENNKVIAGKKVARPWMPGFAVDASGLKTHPYTRIRFMIDGSTDPKSLLDTEELMDIDRVKDIRDRFESGDKNINLVKEGGLLLRISEQLGVPPLEVYNRQLKRADALDGRTHKPLDFSTVTEKVDRMKPEAQLLLNYKNNYERTTLAFRYGGENNNLRLEANVREQLRPIYTEETGAGWTIPNILDKEGDAIVLSPEAWAGVEMLTVASGGGIDLTKDLTTSQMNSLRHPDATEIPNKSEPFYNITKEHSGDSFGVTGDSLEWIKNNPQLAAMYGFTFISESNGIGTVEYSTGQAPVDISDLYSKAGLSKEYMPQSSTTFNPSFGDYDMKGPPMPFHIGENTGLPMETFMPARRWTHKEKE